MDTGELPETGVDEIAGVLTWLNEIEVPYRTERALDFGCGVGLLTQALARTFERCDGVDRTPTMIERARELNRFGERVQYHVDQTGDLAFFNDGTFDFVYSDVVLRHIAPELGARYIHEFTRVLAPGGVTVFEVPSHPLTADETGNAPSAPPNDEPETLPATEIHGIRRANVEALLLAGAVDLVRVHESDGVVGWCDYRYVGIKREPPARTRRRLRDRFRRR